MKSIFFRIILLPAIICLFFISTCTILRDRMPMEELIYPVLNTDAGDLSPDLPVSGDVLIANGASTVGGYAGDQISVAVTFAAISETDEVTEMRISGSCEIDILEEEKWEQFDSVKTYQIKIPLGWSGFTIAVQYRDAQGNLSPIYCDDVNVEGMVKPPDIK